MISGIARPASNCLFYPNLLLFGAKCDLETERCVAVQEGKILAQKIGCGFIETSAKLSDNIDKTFYEAAWRVRKPSV
jgi:GTPase SAR1 family protein